MVRHLIHMYSLCFVSNTCVYMETSIPFEIDDDIVDKTSEGENKAQSVSEKCCNS